MDTATFIRISGRIVKTSRFPHIDQESCLAPDTDRSTGSDQIDITIYAVLLPIPFLHHIEQVDRRPCFLGDERDNIVRIERKPIGFGETDSRFIENRQFDFRSPCNPSNSRSFSPDIRVHPRLPAGGKTAHRAYASLSSPSALPA